MLCTRSHCSDSVSHYRNSKPGCSHNETTQQHCDAGIRQAIRGHERVGARTRAVRRCERLPTAALAADRPRPVLPPPWAIAGNSGRAAGRPWRLRGAPRADATFTQLGAAPHCARGGALAICLLPGSSWSTWTPCPDSAKMGYHRDQHGPAASMGYSPASWVRSPWGEMIRGRDVRGLSGCKPHLVMG